MVFVVTMVILVAMLMVTYTGVFSIIASWAPAKVDLNLFHYWSRAWCVCYLQDNRDVITWWKWFV